MFICMYYVAAFCLSTHRWTDELFSGKQLTCCLQSLFGVSLSRGRGPTSGLGGTAFRERWDGDSVLREGWHLWALSARSELPWWLSGQDSADQCRRHGFSPWSGKTPHAAEHLGLCTTSAEPVPESLRAREPASPRAHPRQKEKPVHCSWRAAPAVCN